jgi:predicted transcriptional regulator
MQNNREPTTIRTMDTYIDNVALRSNRMGLKKLLGDQEAAIMEQVWILNGPILARQIYDRMGADLAYSTVVCTMGRLMQKGLLTVIDDTTKPYRFLPTLTREEFINQAVGRLMDALLEDFPAAVSAVMQREQRLDKTLTATVFALEDES